MDLRHSPISIAHKKIYIKFSRRTTMAILLGCSIGLLLSWVIDSLWVRFVTLPRAKRNGGYL